jgi:ActR/RegA family two-component response regulator
METSDRRYQELLASMGVRRRGNGNDGNDRVQSHASAFFERREVDAIAPGASVGRTTRVQVRLFASQVASRQLQDHHADFAPRLASVAREAKEILLVDPDRKGLRAVQAALRRVANIEAVTNFREARTRLLDQPPDLLVTNLRLHAYNGLHLVHLAAGTHTRCIVYSTYDDLMLGREAQAAGAFFEHPLRLPLVLRSYVNATLPDHDRRNLTMLDRPTAFRGGRRCSDPSSASVQ